MKHSFNSILAKEFTDYIDLRRTAGDYIRNITSYLSSLDRFLIEQNASDKNLTDEVFTKWLATKQIAIGTKVNMLCTANLFGTYMRSLGYSVSVPEKPRVSSEYTPRLFSKEELLCIITAADNFDYKRCSSKATMQFPILLRFLYGCGLRLGEALLLAWRDVDLHNSILTIRTAKNKKQRLVPMSGSLTEILRLYRKAMALDNIADELVFGNRYGKAYSSNGFRKWFSRIMEEAGLEYAKTRKYERGLCPHCLRHQFVMDAFLKADADGRSFEEAVPFLSAYLGHSNILGTEKYLRASYELYTDAQQKISDYINDIFPEVRDDG